MTSQNNRVKPGKRFGNPLMTTSLVPLLHCWQENRRNKKASLYKQRINLTGGYFFISLWPVKNCCTQVQNCSKVRSPIVVHLPCICLNRRQYHFLATVLDRGTSHKLKFGKMANSCESRPMRFESDSDKQTHASVSVNALHTLCTLGLMTLILPGYRAEFNATFMHAIMLLF